ncbi:unnamed protein product [Notodromas monacha]|uniref:Alpha-1,3-mannosyl-glycoprotein 2-beta-N-acetylglucosaminyltransferase n=1 Tax=Notodromas monacha TaxID=399045 RepID=A0A7R9BVI9_9CRUS|nr:unnamed protein product [Notodromas monacha]CAG0921178.1 unnamed protein product [Notodromas monacha]
MRGKRFLFRAVALVACVIVCTSLIYLWTERELSSKGNFPNPPGRLQELDRQLKALEEDAAKQRRESQRLLHMLTQFGLKNLEIKREISIVAAVPDVLEAGVQGLQVLVNSEKSVLIGSSAPPIPIVVIACNRPSVSRALDRLIEFRPKGLEDQFPIYVSQDCGHVETAEIIRGYGSQVIHLEFTDRTPIPLDKKELKWKGYYLISRHYKWALQQVFNKYNHSAVIIVEGQFHSKLFVLPFCDFIAEMTSFSNFLPQDDLEVAADFYDYFLATYPLLLGDKSLFCVSAWNDNGKKNLIDDNAADLLYRSDFFPGLGWMMTRDIWMELEEKWPRGYWDDWIRQPEQRKGRACIRPEISRTCTFGKKGVSLGQFFDKHLKFIVLNSHPVPFTHMDLSYLVRERYDREFLDAVYRSPVVDLDSLRHNKLPEGNIPVRIVYNSRPVFKRIAKALGLMDDFKSGVPRTAYRGVISLFFNSRRVYVSPPPSWRSYDPAWT